LKPDDYSSKISMLASKREPFAVATVVKVEGSTLGKPGFKIIMNRDGEVVGGTLGGVCPESAIVSVGLETMKTGEPRTVKVFLEDAGSAVGAMVKSQSRDEIHVETNCGGVMEIYVEPFLPTERLVLIGQGGKDDVEDALVQLGRMLDYEVVVIDHAPVLSEQPDKLIKDPDFDLTKFDFSPSDSVVILTKGERDVEVLEALLNHGKKVRFIGLLASKKRAKMDIEELERRGGDKEFLGSIHTPVGVDIGAITPAEIAVSIFSEIIAVRHGKHLPHKE
jgi:xanthine dehydrogenase accessory factor